jgi:hypothetical protein
MALPTHSARIIFEPGAKPDWKVITWLQGDHRSALGADHRNRGFRRGDVYIAADDRRILASERQGGRAAHAPAGSRDDANLA